MSAILQHNNRNRKTTNNMDEKPHSLYQLSLSTFVDQLDNKVRSFGVINNLQYLPPAVLSDVYLHVSRKDNFFCVRPPPLSKHQRQCMCIYVFLLRPIRYPKITLWADTEPEWNWFSFGTWPLMSVMSTFQVISLLFSSRVCICRAANQSQFRLLQMNFKF